MGSVDPAARSRAGTARAGGRLYDARAGQPKESEELMTRNGETARGRVKLGTLWVASGMALVACSKGDTVNTGNQGTPVEACGTLSAAEAANLFTSRLDHFATVGLAALAGLENSRAASRVLSYGDNPVIEPFVAESQADVHDGLADLKDDQLIAANVESSTASSVTFLLNPDTMCEGTAAVEVVTTVTGGATGTGGSTSSRIDPECVKTRTAHPTRIRISRIACDQGDNIAIEVLQDPAAIRVLKAELYPERAEVEVDLGAFLKASYSSSGSSVRQSDGTYLETRTEKPLVSAAAGLLRGSIELTGVDRVNGRLSVAREIDFTTADEAPARVRLAAGTDVATFAADGTTKQIQLDLKLGRFDATVEFEGFVRSFFGLTTTDAAAAQPAVDLRLSGVMGAIKFDGGADAVTADVSPIVIDEATATQGANALLSISAAGADHAALGAVFSGNSDESLSISLPKGLAVDIRYGLEPVMSLIEGPANYLARDQLSVTAPSGTNLTLWQEANSNDLAATSSQTGDLARVNAGSLEMRSAVWPNDTIVVPAGQCLSRSETGQSGHDLLVDFAVGACSR